MALLGFLQRIYYILNPPTPAKKDDAIRIGLLGASNIAPYSVIAPAESHPEVIVAAVAARDSARARQYAKKHNIPIVHRSYQDLLNDPSIDAVYIALPNSHHYEWALRSLEVGKHVLLEKPSCSNAAEARALFTHPLATGPNAPVLLEAFHHQFHPAWQTFLTLTRETPWGAGTVVDTSSQFHLPKGYIRPHDIRFKYGLSGGCLMDVATYPLSCVRQVLGRESALLVTDVQYTPFPSSTRTTTATTTKSPACEAEEQDEEPQIDTAISATYQTTSAPNHAPKRAHIAGDLAHTGSWNAIRALPKWVRSLSLPGLAWPETEAILAEILVASQGGTETQHFVQRTVTIWNMILPTVYHRIDVQDRHTLYRNGALSKAWTEVQYLKAYNWPDARAETYRDWWTTWRCQLEEFVNRIRKRKGSGVWIDAAESIRQMEAVDQTYRRAGLKVRPTRAFEG
ncbi:Gfo/Idh/MocA family protein [Aspergillus homomorphus CBS 101889]|uniref:D-xylose 1-dehydrogenase (NADP(+), D-xylono-1,5-lactone-forming) n=1 Tax=Aspergillus homomorphus (strain CBS 101889) TaxID=1450537 RepID=A0A395HUF5_ASPHC|nr:NAD(P)-binding protein [Aspergillus homomorphus CBS 101889]RAL11053.1 NAD(P)-binding protein [Aspergillus homomorphus CBS 101889]